MRPDSFSLTLAQPPPFAIWSPSLNTSTARVATSTTTVRVTVPPSETTSSTVSLSYSPVPNPNSQPLSSVFPNRVGRIILDGMVDPLTHASKPSHLSWAGRLESVDETFQGFAQGCALAGSYGCPLATNTSTGPGIIEWTKDLLAVCVSVDHRLKPHLHLK
jgi:hypothetical protein